MKPEDSFEARQAQLTELRALVQKWETMTSESSRGWVRRTRIMKSLVYVNFANCAQISICFLFKSTQFFALLALLALAFLTGFYFCQSRGHGGDTPGDTGKG